MRLIERVINKLNNTLVNKICYPKITIVMLHRIKPNNNGLNLNELIEISPDILENFIKNMKKLGIIPVRIEDIDHILTENNNKKYIIFTIDDGYKDVIKYGLPIFEKYKIPFTFYISTSMIDKDFVYWWYIIEDLVKKNEKLTLGDGTIMSCKTIHQKIKAFNILRLKILNLPQENFEKEISKILPKNINTRKYNNTLPLNWNEIKRLSKNPLITLGCHAHKHQIFNLTEENIIKNDVLKSIELIQKHAGVKPTHFCYPFGDVLSVSKKHTKTIKALGFKTAVTTRQRIVTKKYKNLYWLPRINLNKKTTQKILDILK